MTKKPNEVGGLLTRLTDYPEHLSRIGLIITDFAGLEQRMCLLLWCLLGDPTRANAVFWSLGSSKARSDVIRGLSNEVLRPNPKMTRLHAELERLVAKFRTVANKRNEIAHAQWGKPAKGGPDPFYSTVRPATKNPIFQKVMSIQDLQAIADEIYDIDNETGTFNSVLKHHLDGCPQDSYLNELRSKFPKLDAYYRKFE